jgi:predicted small metal-binding protein
MKTLSDRDLGIECDFVASGESNDEVIEQMTEHIQTLHPDEFDRVKTMFKMYIKNAPEAGDIGESETDDMT